MIALLNCHGDDLGEHLRHAVSLLRADKKPVDWRQLLSDLLGWDSDDRYVQRTWARGFWGFTTDTEADTEVDTNTSEDGRVAAAKES